MTQLRPITLFSFPAVAAMAALTTLPDLRSQCTAPQGNALLAVNGQPRIGHDLRVAITGLPQAPVFLAADTNGGPIVIPGFGTICLGPSPYFLTGTAFHPLQIIPSLGQWQMDLSIPQVPSLVGATFHMQGLVLDASAPNGKFALSNGVATTILPLPSYTTVFFDGFEATPPQGPWTASNGLWSIDVPTVGPSAFSGSKCAATNPHGSYVHSGEDSTWRSPILALPAIAPGERILLRYRVWFDSENGVDYMQPRILANPLSPTSSFQNLAGTRPMSGTSGAWVQAGADLTQFSGQLVQLGFRFVSQYVCCTGVAGSGFYLDDMLIAVFPPITTGLQQNWDSAQGMGDEWIVDNGIWEVGSPSATSIIQAHTAPRAAGTLLAGNYPHSGTDTRLITPAFIVPPNPIVPQVYFWHSIHAEPGVDYGKVQYTTDGGQTWTDLLGGGLYSGWGNGAWTQTSVLLRDSAGVSLSGQTIQLGFLFVSNYVCCTGVAGKGWFIDDILAL